MQLTGKVAVITGGGTGIGRSIALEFAHAGAAVAVAGRRSGPLEQVVAEIEAAGQSSLHVQTDISKKADVANLISMTVDRFETVDILVNCASVGDVRKPLVDMSEEQWDSVINTNLKGYFLCSQAAGKILAAKNRGTIINIASVAAIRPPSNGGIYNISKAGELMLTLVLARQLAQYNVRVNAISPGMIKTDMTKNVWNDREKLDRLESRIPLGKMGKPDDVAKTALFLASDDSEHITGQSIVVDGGQMLQ
jgi:3-oxoacyl-[acyl-carrier protein] reductase